MKVHYLFIHERLDNFYSLEIIAVLEEKEISRTNVKRSSFRYLEKLRIFISKDDNFHSSDINHEFGEDCCSGHWAHSRSEFLKSMYGKKFKPINQTNYLRFRKVALAIYNKQRLVDFSKFKGKQNYTIKTIIGD